MKTKRSTTLTLSGLLSIHRGSFVALVAAAVSVAAHAQEVKSRPVGFLTQTIPAGQTASFSIPFDPDVSSRPDAIRRVSGVGATYIDSEGAAWSAGAFSAPASPYAVRFTSGQASGRIFLVSSTANTASRLYLETDGLDLGSLQIETGTMGASFEVLPADTLATFFGANTPGDALVVQGGADARAADLVQLWAGSGWKRYYFNTLLNRWALDSDTEVDASRNHALLRPDRGIMITRRGDTPSSWQWWDACSRFRIVPCSSVATISRASWPPCNRAIPPWAASRYNDPTACPAGGHPATHRRLTSSRFGAVPPG